MRFEKLILVIFGVFFFSALVSGESSDYQPVAANEINYIFTIIAASTQSNYDLINTWEGEIESVSKSSFHGDSAEREFHDYRPDDKTKPTEIEVTGKTKRNFTIDMETNSLLIHFTPMAPTLLKDMETGISYESAFSTSPRTIILTPDYGIERSAYTKGSDGKAKQSIVVKSPVSGTADMMRKSLMLGDPRIYLEGNIGLPIWDFMQKTKEFISENGLEVNGKPAIRIEQRSNSNYIDYRIHIHRHTPDNLALGDVMTMTFSGDNNFYLTFRKIQDAKGVLKTETVYEYTVVDGIYLPSRIYTVNYKDGDKNREETIVIKNMRVNQSIPKDSFTYKNCGVKDGDKFIDEILQKEYTYQDGNLIQLEDQTE